MPISSDVKKKLALFCNVAPEYIISNLDVPILYDAPIMLENEGLTKAVLSKLGLEDNTPADMKLWKTRLDNMKNATNEITVALVGKYIQLHDSYLSVVEALKHSAAELKVKLNIKWVDAELVTDENADTHFSDVDGIILPGGFGDRGVEGMISSCAYARKTDTPYLGICLGMQVAAIEFARNALGLTGAHSTEFDPDTPYPIIYIMPDQEGKYIGGTLRLGIYPCRLLPDTKTKNIYNADVIEERHRHRYEFNSSYEKAFSENGMLIAGTSPDGHIVEMLESRDNRWHIAGQFHPEFLSRFSRPHPLFTGFVNAMHTKYNHAL
jgi:CTP synthase